MYRNGEGLAKDQITFAHVLKEVGYETGYIGKWHIASKDTYNWMTTENYMGFDKCKNSKVFLPTRVIRLGTK